jgi:Zn finger protein HypA/HybF involved in hydrogenase expression
MSWEYQLKVWIKKDKHYIQCTCCYGGGFVYVKQEPGPFSLEMDPVEVQKKCEACDGKGYQVAKIEFFDYDTQVPVSSEGQFKLVP